MKLIKPLIAPLLAALLVFFAATAGAADIADPAPSLVICADGDGGDCRELCERAVKAGADMLRLTLSVKDGGLRAADGAPAADILGAFSQKIKLLIDFAPADGEAVADAVKSAGAADRCAFIVRGSAKAIDAFRSLFPAAPECIAVTGSNFWPYAVLRINSFVSAGAAGVLHEIANPYSILWRKSVTARSSGNMRACADLTDPSRCGKREDTRDYWDELVKDGFSLLITAYPELAVQYRADSEAAFERLKEKKAQTDAGFVLPEYSASGYIPYRRNFKTAVKTAETVLAKRAVGASEANEAYYLLDNSVKEIERNREAFETDSAGKTVTVPRVVICVVTVAAFVLVELFFRRRVKGYERKTGREKNK